MAKAKANNRISNRNTQEFRGQLLGWYDRHQRVLPWRARAGQTPDPYHVWLSEIMLQQTTVGAVKEYFEKFLRLWPTVHDLAAAPQENIMNAWAGLGYYARARNLHKCAQIISLKMNGVFPQTQDDLRKLPGIGEYTSAAITAIAFGQNATVVDGNVERVMARLHAVHDPLPGSKTHLKRLASDYFDGANRPGDLAQAFMDLGAGICIAKTPRCVLCPVSEFCQGRALGIAETLPRKEKKFAKPQKSGHVYWIENGRGEVLIHRRPQTGLLAGMLGLPTSTWEEGEAVAAKFPDASDFTGKPVSIHHSFTHFDLRLDLKTATLNRAPTGHFWLPRATINKNEFPTVFKKALKLFLN